MAMKKSDKIWMNGQFVAWDDAKVHVLSHVLHYGSSVFEGIRAYDSKNGPAIFRLGEHIERLMMSSKIYRMQVPYTAEQIERALPRDRVGERPQGLLHPAARLPRLLARRGGPARHADRRDDRRLPVGQVPGRGRAHQGRRGQDRHLGAHGAEHAAGDGQGRRQLPELAAAQARGRRGRLRRGHRARRAGLRERGLGREPVRRLQGRDPHAAGQLQHPLGHHARQRACAWRRTWATRCARR